MIRNRINNYKTNSLSKKIFSFFVPLFTVTSVVIFGIVFLSILRTLTIQDHKDLELKLSELEIIYNNGGLRALKDEIEFNKLLNRDRPFFVRIADYENQTLLSTVPTTWKDFQFENLEQIPLSRFKSIYAVSSPEREFEIEIITRSVDDKYYFQVGGSTRVRKEILEHALQIFFVLIIPTIIILIIWIAIFTSRLLRPISTMISFVQQIVKSGDYNKTLKFETNIAEIEELISIFNKMLKKAQSLINRLRNVLDSLAHDIRTPVTKIRATAELALEKPEDKLQTQKSLAVCIEECSKLIHFTKAVLELSEVEYGIVEITKKEIDIIALVQEVVEVYKFIAEKKEIHIEMIAPPRLFIDLDEVRFKQAINNILDNAVKYSPKKTKITMKIENSEDSVHVILRDQGIGISKERLGHIWDRSYSYDPEKENNGYGLGLHIAKVFIEAHNGEITINSKEGEGSCFTIRLPK